MADMIAFCTAMLTAVCDFLITPPIFYLFSLVCFCAVVTIVLKLMNNLR